MDNSGVQSPSIESFSYSWLADLDRSPFEEDAWIVPDRDEASSFIEMDPRLPPSRRFIRVSSSDLGFDFPVLPVDSTASGIVHADELISGGFVVPLLVRDTRMDRYGAAGVDDDCYASGNATSTTSTDKSGRASLRRRQRAYKRLFYKYLKFLFRPLFYRRPRRGRQFERSSSSSNNSNKKMMSTAQKWEFSAATSPRTSMAYSVDDNWRRSCDSDSSIYEAVLHCKRTQGK